MTGRGWGLALGLALASAAPAAQIVFDSAADNAFPTLAVPVGVRAAGMGDVYTAVGDDVYSLRWNPAGLARMQGFQVGLMDNEWSSALGLREDFLAYGQALESGGAWAASVDYFNLGQLDQRDSTGALLGSEEASALGFNLGYGWALMGRQDLKLGLAAEAVQQKLYGASQWGYGLSPGLLWEPLDRWSVGLSLNHLGLSSAGGSTPAELQAGVSSLWLARTLILAADAELPKSGTPALKAGGELAYDALRFRAGWRQPLGGADSQDGGFTAGVGFQAGLVTLDYSYTPYGSLSTVQRIQATVDLPADFFQPHVSMADGTTTTARTYFDDALDQERHGETLKALIGYQRCVEAYPAAQRSTAQPFYAEAGKKIQDLQTQLAKGGDHTQILKLSADAVAQAELLIKAGRFKEAITRLEQAQKLDPSNAMVLAKLVVARQDLDLRLSGARDAAHFAVKDNNLAMAVESYRKILAQDPDDSEALAYLTAKRSSIKALLQSIDRKAIYFYVGGQLEDAIKAWSDGAALDYFGDVDFKRNIDKARVQLQLRSQN
ncbi:MAG TPA: PorV/PorQ family protein [bacterium]|nr:PorV/PorQ family protein [bacterium]